MRIGSQFRGDARQQHGLPPAARAHDERVLAGRRVDVLAENLQDRLQFPRPHYELVDDVLVRLEDARIEFSDGALRWLGHGVSPSRKPIARFSAKGL